MCALTVEPGRSLNVTEVPEPGVGVGDLQAPQAADAFETGQDVKVVVTLDENG